MAIQIFLSIIITFFLFIIFLGIGSACFSFLKIKTNSYLLNWLSKTGFGFGIFANIIMILCLLGIASKNNIRFLFLLLFIFFFPFALKETKSLYKLIKQIVFLLRINNPLINFLFIALILGYFFRGLLPPTDFDGLMYHLALIKLFLNNHGFYYVFFNPHSEVPMLTEMIFMIGLAFNNDIICKTISFGIGLLACASIGLFCKEYFKNIRIIIPSLLVFLTLTNTIANMSTCYVDIPVAVWIALSIFFSEIYYKKGKLRYAAICGFFCGMCIESKVFGAIVVPLICIKYLFMLKNVCLKTKLIALSVVLLISFILAFPWAIKCYIHKEHIDPLKVNVIPIANHENIIKGKIKFLAKNIFINLPLKVILAPWSFCLFSTYHLGETFGWIFLAILPFLIFMFIPPKTRLLLIYAGIYLFEMLLVEIFIIHNGSCIRYSTFILLALPPILIWTIKEMFRVNKKLYGFMILMLSCHIALGSLLFFKRYHKDWKALLTMTSRDKYYESILLEYPVIKKINSIRDSSIVMPVYNFSNYLLDVPYIAAYKRYSNVEELKNDLKEKKVKYLFGNNVLDTAENKNVFPELKEKQLVYSKNGFYLFKISCI
jgi:4-amino-4-deoxy-L-arabinose transferase-like glycosyltransferase